MKISSLFSAIPPNGETPLVAHLVCVCVLARTFWSATYMAGSFYFPTALLHEWCGLRWQV